MSDVAHRNLVAVLDHSKRNERAIQDLEETVDSLYATIRVLNERLEQQNSQISTLQVAVFSGRATHGNIH